MIHAGSSLVWAMRIRRGRRSVTFTIRPSGFYVFQLRSCRHCANPLFFAMSKQCIDRRLRYGGLEVLRFLHAAAVGKKSSFTIRCARAGRGALNLVI